MKLIIQIPCFNEEANIAKTLAALPDSVPGFDEIEVLVIDDGSSDKTVDTALQCGAFVFSLPQHTGLAGAFAAGIQRALSLNADVIVNTDADNQYEATDIAALVRPILNRSAQIAIGDREVSTEEFFSPLKRFLQVCGSGVVSLAAGFSIPDATSGFRAFSREAAARIVLTSHFSYTLETLIQSRAVGSTVAFVPIHTNAPTRPSRLMRGTGHYMLISTFIILRSLAIYHPQRTFIAGFAANGLVFFGALMAGSGTWSAIAAAIAVLGTIAYIMALRKRQSVLTKVTEQLLFSVNSKIETPTRFDQVAQQIND